MNINFYLINDKKLAVTKDYDAFEYVDGNWIQIEYNEISDRLIGYDPYEPDDSTYKIGNLDIMSSIKKITEDEAKELIGQSEIEKIK